MKLFSPIIIICILVINQTYCDNGDEELYPGITTFDKTGAEFQKMILDKTSGSLYVGGINNLYRISSNKLSLIQNTTIGPEFDSIECDPSGVNCSSLIMTNNEIKVLLMDPTFDKLLVCGSITQGLCSFHDKNNLSMSVRINGGGVENVVNYVGGQDSIVARYKGAPMRPQLKVLYVGQEYDSRPIKFAAPALSSRQIKEITPNQYHFEYIYHNELHGGGTFKDIHQDFKNSYRVKYVYLFEHREFSFYLTVQRQYIDVGNYSTRLAIVCNKDPTYSSYTEIELACRKKNGVTSFFNIAEAAYFGEIGQEFVQRFNIDPANETVLYILFGKSFPKSRDIDEEAGSGLCLFTMSAIMKEYQSGQRDCYSGRGSLLPWIHPGNIDCTERISEVVEIDKDPYYCGTDPRNDAVGRRGYDLQTDTNVTLAGHYATSILIQVQNDKTVAILGTAKGTVLKVLIDGTNAPPYIDINITPEGTPNPRVAKDMIFNENGSHVYAMTKGRIAKIPIQTCDLYQDCGSCLSTRDALKCGWCSDGQGHCSARKQCTHAFWSQHSCPPAFYNFEPRSGPVQGGTLVTLQGANFGNHTLDSVKVTVALEDCPIKFHNTTLIICTTKPSKNKEKSFLVAITVVDTSKTTVNFEIRGKVDLGHVVFSYKEVKLKDIAPLLGPKSGGSRLTVTGQNLDVGSNLNISVASLPCVPNSVKSDKIICESSALQSGNRKRSLASGPITVTIDGVQLHREDLVFHYEEDPYVTDIHPRKSIASGGINVTISGGNLQVVHEPKMVIQDEAIGVNYFDDCEAGTDIMICTAPALTAMFSDGGKGPTPGQPLYLTLNFAMDGVKELIDFPSSHPELSAFEYHVDPHIYSLDDDDNVLKFYTSKDYLELKGEYLNQGIDKQDYEVTIGGDICEVTALKEQKLYCRPHLPLFLSENEAPRSVLVKVGYLEFLPGHIQYTERNLSVLVASILVPLLAIVVVVIIIVLLLWMRKTHKGPFKRNEDLPSVRFTANPENIDGRDRLLHHSNPYAASPLELRQRHVVTEREHEPLIDSDCRKFLEDSRLLINRDDLLLLDIIGQGNFGCVFKGLLKFKEEKQETEVAVKTLKTLTEAAYTSTSDARSFLEEALRMREFDHPNILRLIGIALDKEDQPLVILPFMKHGDLLTYIRDETNSPTIKDLMDFGIQVAEGMSYLSKLKFVHRDLAARNCMLNDNMDVQVADFGLSRDIYERDYYSSDGRKAKLPVKWMSLESLEKGIYNTKSDVWSYGVVLWELMTRGVTPYPEVDNWEIIKFLKPGRRMPQPAYCPDTLYRVMLTCWDPNPNNRPTFPEIVTTIHRIVYEMENRQEQHQQATNELAPHMYSNVPTSQNYLYPATLPQYSMHGGNVVGGGDHGGGRDMLHSGEALEFRIRDHNENEQSPNFLV